MIIAYLISNPHMKHLIYHFTNFFVESCHQLHQGFRSFVSVDTFHFLVLILKINISNFRTRGRSPTRQLGSLSNHDDDGNKTPTNLHIWQWKTGFLHALHVHFSSFDILKTFSFFLPREMTCFAVVWTTWAYDDKCSILSSYVPSAGSNLISVF